MKTSDARDPLPPVDTPGNRDLPDVHTPGIDDVPRDRDLPDIRTPGEDVPDHRDLPQPPLPPVGDPLPPGPNQDMGNPATPPVEVGKPRLADDDDLDNEAGGVSNTRLRTPYERIARRDDLARQLEELLVTAQEWADEDGSDEARDIYERLYDVHVSLGAALEETDR